MFTKIFPSPTGLVATLDIVLVHVLHPETELLPGTGVVDSLLPPRAGCASMPGIRPPVLVHGFEFSKFLVTG